MRAGWSCKGAARVLGIGPTHLTQALEPAMRKVALLWAADPTLTMETLLDAVGQLECERRNEPMPAEELDTRDRLGRGQIDRAAVTSR